jgi:hypothetical protein
MHCSYIKCLADQYITGEIRSFTDPMLRKLPREIRDMIYEFLCEDSEEPFCAEMPTIKSSPPRNSDAYPIE